MAEAVRTQRDRRRDALDCRCLCGSLVARRVPGGIELRCRRCKRDIVVPLEPPASSARTQVEIVS